MIQKEIRTGRRLRRQAITLGILLCLGGAGPAGAADSPSGDAAQVLRSILQKQILASGTLDWYDESKKKVRNLRLEEIVSAQFTPQQCTGEAVYRDIQTGDLLTLKITAVRQGEMWGDPEITLISEQSIRPTDAEKRTFSDAEILKIMRDYIESQVKFTGTLMMFDQERETMRTMKFLNLEDKLRRLGIYSIARAWFEDTQTQERVGIDVTVENRDGILNVQSLRIRQVKPPVGK